MPESKETKTQQTTTQQKATSTRPSELQSAMQEAEAEREDAPTQESGQPELEAPTSNDVGKQTLTKADLGYDVTKEGTPPDDVAMASPRHPDDPSKDEDDERDTP